MRARPWPIVILALLHILGPLGNIALSAHLSQMGLGPYLKALLWGQGILGVIDFFFLIPAAGIAIWVCRKWSYPVFLGIAAETVYSNYQTWRTAPGVFTLPMLMTTVALDVVFVSYFLIPVVRQTYMNPKLRWWEAQRRYPVKLSGHLAISGKGSRKCQIRNVSQGGAFITTTARLRAGKKVTLRFEMMEREFELKSKVVYAKSGRAGGFGLNFVETDLKRMVSALELIGVRPLNRVDWRMNLVDWSRKVVTEGKGLVPDIEKSKAA